MRWVYTRSSSTINGVLLRAGSGTEWNQNKKARLSDPKSSATGTELSLTSLSHSISISRESRDACGEFTVDLEMLCGVSVSSLERSVPAYVRAESLKHRRAVSPGTKGNVAFADSGNGCCIEICCSRCCCWDMVGPYGKAPWHSRSLDIEESDWLGTVADRGFGSGTLSILKFSEECIAWEGEEAESRAFVETTEFVPTNGEVIPVSGCRGSSVICDADGTLELDDTRGEESELMRLGPSVVFVVMELLENVERDEVPAQVEVGIGPMMHFFII